MGSWRGPLQVGGRIFPPLGRSRGKGLGSPLGSGGGGESGQGCKVANGRDTLLGGNPYVDMVVYVICGVVKCKCM